MVAVASAFAFIFFLFGSLAVFSKIYRRRKANEAPPASWYGPHKSRDLYISLLSLEPPPPQPILVAALLRRALDDVKLIWAVRDQKAALSTLLAKGQIGDDTWERFLLAEKELEAEIIEVVGEANAFQEGYGQNIFPLASEMATHEKWKDVYNIEMAKDREAQLARATSGPPSLVLSPISHLTPSSLTLYPSNPLTLAHTPPTPASPPQITPAPAAVPTLTPSPSAPTTPRKTPTKSSKVLLTTPADAPPLPTQPGSQPQPPPASVDGDADADDDAGSEQASPSVSGTSTPTPSTPGSAKKKNKKKKTPAKK